MSDYTPGPWTVGDKRGVWVGPVVMADDGKRGVAFVVGGSVANARLLAAAPELLAALKRVVQYIDEYPTGGYHINDVIRQCHALIAKAEGRGE